MTINLPLSAVKVEGSILLRPRASLPIGWKYKFSQDESLIGTWREIVQVTPPLLELSVVDLVARSLSQPLFVWKDDREQPVTAITIVTPMKRQESGYSMVDFSYMRGLTDRQRAQPATKFVVGLGHDSLRYDISEHAQIIR